jgi:hypothetical protein
VDEASTAELVMAVKKAHPTIGRAFMILREAF